MLSPSQIRPKVCLASLTPEENYTLSRLKRIVDAHRPSQFIVCDRAEEADLILLIEYGYLGISALPRYLALTRAHPDARIALFSETDWPFAFVPGLFPSLTRPDLPWAGSWSYLLEELDHEPYTNREPRFLFSFAGRFATHPVRRALKALDRPETPVIDSGELAERFPDWNKDRSYSELIGNSQFVLCPRGFGASSIRIFEAMRLARVPVIISDAWLPPPVGDWNQMCVRVGQSEIHHIPEMLERLSPDAAAMGRRASELFNEYFAPSRFLDRLLEQVIGLAPAPAFPIRATRAMGRREFRSLAGELAARLVGGHGRTKDA